MIHKIFPTFILEKINFIDQKKCKHILNEIRKQKKHLKKYEAFKGKGYTTYLNKDNYLNSLDSSIKESLLSSAKEYSTITGFNINNKITSSWFNIQKQNSSLKEHTHPLSVFSGILYIKCKEGSFDTYFFNPNPMLNFFTTMNKNTETSSEWVSFKPKAGTLLLFPSWLKHGSNFTKNKCSERVVISFNIT